MEGIVVALIGVMVGYWIFRAGKREGSTKGYGGWPAPRAAAPPVSALTPRAC
jgi:hypothetical protein